MKTYEVFLQSELSKTFYCEKAANSLDIDVQKKSIHHVKIDIDLDNDFNVGVFLGASGGGKTTLAKQIFGNEIFDIKLNEDLPIIDQFDQKYSYDERANMLSGIGLTSVMTWIRPIKTLSNGQKARAESAWLMSSTKDLIVIDEWSSVVDRTVAKVMSHCVQKFARKFKKKIILLSCHNDVLDWLDPDFIVDCNKQDFIDRRLLSSDERRRKEQLEFTIREIDKSTWKYFSKYHYLSDKLPVGKIFIYGLFHKNDQIGFQCFANYCPHKDKSKKMIYHSNRTVIHPDYAGLGLGIKLINKTSKIIYNKGFRVFGAFSSTPVFKSMTKQKDWVLRSISRDILDRGGSSSNKNYMRTKVKMYSFEYVGGDK
jgi:Fe-S cluster assembly ATPase SufC